MRKLYCAPSPPSSRWGCRRPSSCARRTRRATPSPPGRQAEADQPTTNIPSLVVTAQRFDLNADGADSTTIVARAKDPNGGAAGRRPDPLVALGAELLGRDGNAPDIALARPTAVARRPCSTPHPSSISSRSARWWWSAGRSASPTTRRARRGVGLDPASAQGDRPDRRDHRRDRHAGPADHTLPSRQPSRSTPTPR